MAFLKKKKKEEDEDYSELDEYGSEEDIPTMDDDIEPAPRSRVPMSRPKEDFPKPRQREAYREESPEEEPPEQQPRWKKKATNPDRYSLALQREVLALTDNETNQVVELNAQSPMTIFQLLVDLNNKLDRIEKAVRG